MTRVLQKFDRQKSLAPKLHHLTASQPLFKAFVSTLLSHSFLFFFQSAFDAESNLDCSTSRYTFADFLSLESKSVKVVSCIKQSRFPKALRVCILSLSARINNTRRGREVLDTLELSGASGKVGDKPFLLPSSSLPLTLLPFLLTFDARNLD